MISKIRIREAIKKKFDEKQLSHSKELNKNFVFWCRLELANTFFSILGLFIAIIDYEMSLFEGGAFQAIAKMGGVHKEASNDSDYTEVFNKRMDMIGNSTMRWLNTICTILAILFLALRNYFRMEWKNKHYNT